MILKNFFVSVFLLPTLLSAQPFEYDTAHYLLTELRYENSTGEKGITTYIHDPHGKIYKSVWKQMDANSYSEGIFQMPVYKFTNF